MKEKIIFSIKLLFTNICIVLIAIFVTELFFGYWFDKDNFGPYMREHRMKNQKIIWTYKNEIIEYNYKRNYYGFRAGDIEPSDIDAIILGGSMIDERYKPSQYTITEYLNKGLRSSNDPIKIVNAGVEGQSTKGIVSAFENWLFKIKEFKPRYVLIYTGINDQSADADNVISLATDGHLLNPEKIEVFMDNFKSRSFLYDQARIFKYKVLSTKKDFVKYDGKIDESYKKNYFFKGYKQAKKDIKKDTTKTNTYLKRIDKIHDYSKQLGAKPIFITNISAAGHTENTFLLNTALIEHCGLKKYACIDLAKNLSGDVNYWYDGVHTTKEGSEIIASLILPELLIYLDN